MKLKALISVILTLTFVFSLVPCFAAEENRVTDDFQAYTSNANEGDIWTGRPIVNEDGNKSAVIGAGNGDTLYAKTNGFSADITGIIAKFSVKFNNNVKQNVIFGASSATTPVGSSFRLLQFYAGGSKMQIAASKDISISYTSGKWYDISMQLNYDTGYYHLTVDDGSKVKEWSTTQASLKRDDTQKAALKYYSFWIDSNAKTESVQIDNVDIYGTTDNRIYPEFSETYSFDDYISDDGITPPLGFTADGELSAENGFVSSDGAVRFVSSEDKAISLRKSFDSAINPPCVKIKLTSAVMADFTISLTDSVGTEEILTVSSDGISHNGSKAEYSTGKGCEIGICAKDGKLRVIVYGEGRFGTIEADSQLADLKDFAVISPEGVATDICVDSISFATSKYFEFVSSSVAGKPLPSTKEIELEFSDAPIGGIFSIDGDRTVDEVIYSGNKVKLILDDILTPDTSYMLSFANVLNSEGVAILGEIPFKTDVAVYADSFDIELSSDAYTITANLKSNTGSEKEAVILLTAYSEADGKILAMDFENIIIGTVSKEYSLEIPKPDCADYSVEAYLWDGFENMKSLGYTDIQGGAQR